MKTKPIAPEASKALIALYTPLVHKIAGGFQRKLPRNVLREDLIAAGMVGLWQAIQNFNRSPESFEWYVRVRVRGAILDELRTQDWLPRRARAAYEAAAAKDGEHVASCPAVVRFDDVSAWEQSQCLRDNSSSEAVTAAKEVQSAIFDSIDILPERERFIIAQHYFKGVKFKVIAVELGVSEPRISQLHARAMQRLRANAQNLSAAL